jgi:DNA-binding GntR family transcriptional regulator
VRAIEAGDGDAAAAAMAAHLDHIEASTRAVIEADAASFARRPRKSE